MFFAKNAAEGQQDHILSWSDVFICFLRITYLERIPQSLEYFYGLGELAGILPCLQKLYKDDEEGLKEAMIRENEVFITEGNLGSIVMGAALAMEEQKAMGADIDGSVITNFKVSMMGPMAGIGDTMVGYVIVPINTSIFLGFAMEGSLVALLYMPVGELILHGLGYVMWRLGYDGGRIAVLNVLQGAWLDRIVVGAGIMGMLMMGALAGQYVTLEATGVINIGAMGTIEFSEMFNQILPGFLPLCILVGGYFYLEKGKKATNLKLMGIYLVICVVGTLIHFF